jgi:hypothetical protein
MGEMTGLGHSRPNWDIPAMSGLPPFATEPRTSLEVGFVPTPELLRRTLFRVLSVNGQRSLSDIFLDWQPLSLRSLLILIRLST